MILIQLAIGGIVMKKIAFANQKGGVGKSTSCINIAAILGDMGYKVLVIDLDPQGNCSQGFGFNENDLQNCHTVYDILVNETPISECITSTVYKNVDIIPAHIILANAELELASAISRETVLQSAILESKLKHDFVLLDLPPSLGLLTFNGLAAADKVIIPIDIGVFAVSGINQLIRIINMVKNKLNKKLSIMGILINKADRRTNLSKEIQSDLNKAIGDMLFKNVIHINVRITEAQREQKPVIYYDKECRGAEEYRKITEEIISKF